MNKEIITKNIDETIKFAEDLSISLKRNDIVCLYGDLGVGKSVIARAIGNFFNVDTSIISPTFNILKTYNIKDAKIKKINHFDLYRIKNIDELINIGFEDYIYEDGSLNIIEWPEIAKDLLPDSVINIIIKRISDTKRSINFIND